MTSQSKLPFSAAEAGGRGATRRHFPFQVVASELEQDKVHLLKNYPLRFTLADLLRAAKKLLVLLGTGTLFEHEDPTLHRQRPDHIFRTDKDDPNSPLAFRLRL